MQFWLKVALQVRNLKKKCKRPWYLYYHSASRDGLSFKSSSMIQLSSSDWLGPLSSSQTWTNSDNIPKNNNFSLDFDNFCKFANVIQFWLKNSKPNKQIIVLWTCPLLWTLCKDTLQDGIIGEWKKFRQEIPVCLVQYMSYVGTNLLVNAMFPH